MRCSRTTACGASPRRSRRSSTLEGFPPTPFASDARLEWRGVDPWTGYLSDSTGCAMMRMPFLPGTAPSITCGMAGDTLGFFNEDTGVDTSETSPQEGMPEDTVP